jgi:16S rRNA (guanine527-N7)-methyltransferase
MQQPVMREITGPKSFETAFSVSRETVERLKIYERLLQHWQKTINLVAPSTLTQVWARHFADSAQILRHAPENPKTWVDLGSGAGFPGLVVAIMLAEKSAPAPTADPKSTRTKVTLVESDSRKAAFLREVAREVAVPVDILPLRIEAAATQASLKRAGAVSARALAPMPRLLALAAPFFGPETVGLFLKGREATRECQAAGLEWNFDRELVPSLTDPEARVVVVRKIQPKT